VLFLYSWKGVMDFPHAWCPNCKSRVAKPFRQIFGNFENIFLPTAPGE
jgi:hypothetical protein